MNIFGAQRPRLLKMAVTMLIVGVAAATVLVKYRHYLANPWTRDGQVRAIVITVAPRVTGPIVNLPVVDNQFVKAGDLLFEIDPRTFISKLRQAEANLDQTVLNLLVLDKSIQSATEALRQSEAKITEAQSYIDGMKAQYRLAKKNYGRASTLVGESAIAVSEYDQNKENRDLTHSQLAQGLSALNEAEAANRKAEADLAKAISARGPTGEDNPQLRAAQAALEDARLNYEFTRQHASVDGYVTNLNLRLGSQAVADQAALALVDADSFWVAGYFMETEVADIRPGQPAVVTFMSYPETPIPGEVESIGWGIFQSDGSTGQNLLPTVSPTFEWIRLAQRIPVRVRVKPPSAAIKLRVGMTASVLVMTGQDAAQTAKTTPPLPRALQ